MRWTLISKTSNINKLASFHAQATQGIIVIQLIRENLHVLDLLFVRPHLSRLCWREIVGNIHQSSNSSQAMNEIYSWCWEKVTERSDSALSDPPRGEGRVNCAEMADSVDTREASAPAEQTPHVAAPAQPHAVPSHYPPEEVEASRASSLSSLRSSIRQYRKENGRRYHALSDGNLTHHLWRLTFDGKLCMCPKVMGANSVLDIGTGTGIWAIDYAESHPSATVIGVDLSPIQPGFFEVDDIEKDWTWSTKFDFIHIRHMNSAIANWERLLRQAYDNLEPGGYVELTDNCFPLQCQDGTMDPKSPVAEWSTLLMEACDRMGRPVTVPALFKNLLLRAGFVDVVEVHRIWPLHDWPKNDQLKEIGRYSQESSLQGCEASALALFTRVLGWTRDETLVFCSGVRKDLHNRNIHAYWDIYCAFGRKPFDEPSSESEPESEH
ncbi:methyltransferase domain-containing protein [Colletotrichum scovillei]|uniref:Methyltransferase domain-containing protein n=1 Tax=Colletotrichum scovillei TaxID=1209932 RepID=A0A9P7RE85_9PEZI|nr:methyltransferase domain-containing protein [Colletotrichum scovillei]KAG7075133.1 methyltransferase domain-containing protein [Colletotrichum scovillei]